MGSFNVAYLAGGRLDPPYFPTFTRPYIIGFSLDLSKSTDHTYTLTEDREFVGIYVGFSSYNEGDNFTVEHNGKVILDTVYAKEIPEGIYLMVAHPVKKGDIISFKFMGLATDKYVWFNYQFLNGSEITSTVPTPSTLQPPPPPPDDDDDDDKDFDPDNPTDPPPPTIEDKCRVHFGGTLIGGSLYQEPFEPNRIVNLFKPHAKADTYMEKDGHIVSPNFENAWSWTFDSIAIDTGVQVDFIDDNGNVITSLTGPLIYYKQGIIDEQEQEQDPYGPFNNIFETFTQSEIDKFNPKINDTFFTNLEKYYPDYKIKVTCP